MLSDLVQVQAVQGPEGLRGYRVEPGKNAKEFMAMGFEPGDVVTAVNDLPLSDPGNGVRLYGLMRTAAEARFTIERDGSELTLSVNLQSAEQGAVVILEERSSGLLVPAGSRCPRRLLASAVTVLVWLLGVAMPMAAVTQTVQAQEYTVNPKRHGYSGTDQVRCRCDRRNHCG